MRVLVTVASKHGATSDIGRAIGETLGDRGVDVVVASPEDAPDVEGFDAVGSSIYAGRWLKVAKEFVERNAETLRARPVWIFSSGPLGEPLAPAEEPVDAPPMIQATAAREHRVFAGKLDRSKLGLVEKAMVKAVHAPEGDYRNWDEIQVWALGVADALACST